MKNQSVRGLSLLSSEIARDVLLLAVLAIAARVMIHFTFSPAWVGDSGGYWEAGNAICKNFQAYDFGRTPGYPLFLQACARFHGRSPFPGRMSCAAATTAILCQHLFGIALCCMLYKTLRNLKVGRWVSLGGAAIYGTLLGLAVVERFVLPISLTLFLLGASTWLFSEGLVSGRRWPRVASGFVLSLAVLTRPETIIFLLGFVFSYALASWACGKRFQLKTQLLPFSAGAFPLVFAWILLFRISCGFFGLTQLAGWSYSATAYNMFHLVEKKDAMLGQIMVKYYRGPVRKDMVCDAWYELWDRRAELPIVYLRNRHPEVYLSRYIGEVSLGLLLKHPGMWLENAKDNWQQTYIFDARDVTPPLGHTATLETVDHKAAVKNATLSRCVVRILGIQAWAMILAYGLSTGYIGLFVFWLRKPSSVEPASLFVLAVACAALGMMAAFALSQTSFLAMVFPTGVPWFFAGSICCSGSFP